MAHILLIDDDDFLREVLASTLAQAGHTVVQARDGRQVVDFFRVESADLVITDLIMPDREGIETLVALRRETPGMPIIAMSGGSTHSGVYLATAVKLGARRALAKPFTPEVLLRAVDEVLAGSRGSGPAP